MARPSDEERDQNEQCSEDEGVSNNHAPTDRGIGRSGVCKSRRVGPSGAVARLGVVVSLVTHQASDRVMCVFRMNCPGVHGDAGLAPAVGLIRSLSALGA